MKAEGFHPETLDLIASPARAYEECNDEEQLRIHKNPSIILTLNHLRGQTVHTLSGERWSVTQGLMERFRGIRSPRMCKTAAYFST